MASTWVGRCVTPVTYSEQAFVLYFILDSVHAGWGREGEIEREYDNPKTESKYLDLSRSFKRTVQLAPRPWD